MKEFKFDGYELYSTDGYTHDHVAYFTHETNALAVKGNNHYMGVTATSMTVRVFETTAEYYEQRDINKREAALAKLTREDRIALGLLMP